MLQLLVQRSGETVVLKCSGRLVAGDGLDALQRTARAQRASVLLIDLAGADSLDAAGLGALLAVREWCASQTTVLKLLNPSQHVREILALTALDSVLEVRPEESESDLEVQMREWACAES